MGVAVRGHGHDEGAPRGKKTGPNSMDRGKSGTKRSILVEGNGLPLATEIAGADRHDMRLAEPTPQSMVVERPRPTKKHPQNVCMDKGYDFPAVDELVAEWGCTVHIPRRGVDQSKRERNTRLPVEEMGRREDPLVDEPVQTPTVQAGEEKEELAGDGTPPAHGSHTSRQEYSDKLLVT